MRKYTFLLVFMLLACQLYAQRDKTSYINDPNHNPKLWKEILANPEDGSLWAKYMGRSSWEALTASEKQRIEIWKRDMSAALKSRTTDGTPSSLSPTATGKEEKKPLTAYEKKMALIREAEKDGKTIITKKDQLNFEGFVAEYTKDSPQMKDLKKNILANFRVIEDQLFQKYIDLGRDYTYYHEVYPNEEYSFEKWVSEHEAKIRKWKQEQMGEISANFFVVVD